MQELVLKAEDQATDLGVIAEKITTIANDIANSFFDFFDTETEEGRFSILYSFKRTRIKHDIMMDYISEISKEIVNISTLMSELKHNVRETEVKIA